MQCHLDDDDVRLMVLLLLSHQLQEQDHAQMQDRCVSQTRKPAVLRLSLPTSVVVLPRVLARAVVAVEGEAEDLSVLWIDRLSQRDPAQRSCHHHHRRRTASSAALSNVRCRGDERSGKEMATCCVNAGALFEKGDS